MADFFKGVDHMQNEQKTVGIGVQDFSKLKEENLFYIDKTAFIKEWWESGFCF